MRRPRARVRRHAVRTALLAAAVVAAVLTMVCVATDVIVSQRLVGAIDQHLGDHLAHLSGAQLAAVSVSDEEARDLDDPLVGWSIGADGTVRSTDNAPALPAGLHDVAAAQTVTLAGTDFRIAGTPVSGGRVLLASSLAPVSRAMDTLIIAEVAVGPVVLLAVFIGAIAVGRRVAGPVEHARRRQLAFTADASHELRTPLAVIQAETALALDERGEASRASLQRIADESARMRHIVEDLLWLARVDAEPPRPAAGPIDVGVLAASAADRFAALASTHGQRLDVDIDEAPAIIDAPAEWIDRLAGVLLDNACRYSGDRATIRIAVGSRGDRVRLTVSDTGPGLPAEHRDRLFDRFHRGTDASSGAGLGLAIADSVVRGTGGHWDLGDGSGGGAALSVMWPAARRGS